MTTGGDGKDGAADQHVNRRHSASDQADKTAKTPETHKTRQAGKFTFFGDPRRLFQAAIGPRRVLFDLSVP